MNSAAIPRIMGNLVDITHVMLVQRDSDRREQNAHALKQAGFIVRQADDGRPACTEAVAWPAGVIVTDIVLPMMSGFELCRRLREDSRTAESFILGVTSWTGSDDYVRAMKAGFDLLISDKLDTPSFAAEVQRIRPQGASLRRKAQAIQRQASDLISEAATALTARRRSADRRVKTAPLSREDALKRIRADYFELPGLKLTATQG